MSENGVAPNNSSGEDRQFVHFSFYKLDRRFRELPAAAREAARDEFAAVVEQWAERFAIRAYTTFGIRPDVDLMLWKVSERLEDFQELATALHATALGALPGDPVRLPLDDAPLAVRQGRGPLDAQARQDHVEPRLHVPADLPDGQDPRAGTSCRSRRGRGS